MPNRPTLIIEGEAVFSASQCYECSLPGEIHVGGFNLIDMVVEKCPIADTYEGWSRELGVIKITIKYEGKAP